MAIALSGTVVNNENIIAVTLSRVVAALFSTVEGGRPVGIIAHVAILRKKIDKKLQ